MILQDVIQHLSQDLEVFLSKILETSCQELIQDFVGYSQDLVGIYIFKILAGSCPYSG